MQVWRRVRGLLGSAATWGTVGALIGAAMYVARYRPWPLGAIHWDRALSLMGAFMGGGALWGSVCGLAFGVAVWSLGRRSSFQQVSARRFTLWGAVAGAAFPLLIYTPVVVMRGAFDAIPFFSMIAGISAVAGAACARTIFALARRAPEPRNVAPVLAASSPASMSTVPPATPERVQVR